MHLDENALNEYADGTVDSLQRAGIERHLETCVACRSTVSDLRELRRAAAALEPIVPPPHIWLTLQDRIGEKRSHAVFGGMAFVWLGAAAAVILVAVVVGLRFRPAPAAPSPSSSVSVTNADAAQTVETELRLAEEHYVKAIKGLEQLAGDGEGSLDPSTATTLQNNLAVIDQAINESRSAVYSHPTNEPAQQSLLENFRTKIAVLQDTVALINEMRKGNEAGAARIVSGLKQQP